MLPLRWPGRPPGTTEQPSAGAEARPTSDYPPPSSTKGGGGEPVDVEVRTSTRRRKTATAYWESGHIVVIVPSHVRRADRQELVDWLVGRVLAKRPAAVSSDEELAARAAALADRYVNGVRPASIRWVTNQNKRWGSCSNATGDIRISHRLRAVPEWVLDATIVHELAHLVHADHSSRFHAVANRHPRQKDALVFLEGYSLGLRTATA
jgi:predicted metal-dependent hydrolase